MVSFAAGLFIFIVLAPFFSRLAGGIITVTTDAILEKAKRDALEAKKLKAEVAEKAVEETNPEHM